jgi:hypothetical protein
MLPGLSQPSLLAELVCRYSVELFVAFHGYCDLPVAVDAMAAALAYHAKAVPFQQPHEVRSFD